MAYTNIAKPTSSTYTPVFGYVKVYDQSEISYDDPTMFYDGVNQMAYTNIAKPSSSSYTNIPKPT